ncbi:hypothetical protein RclHR1_01730026 [Rhizophagus clarus]|uniref:Uncharacterized protein n=1 Tax=Rhizophagus clarus TaxID=94130 RepID=A0A2Z6RCY2_9GLOM|nr:hypothetical protein RclHR1_01730026 [Rhizophagus clarus]GES90045.1 hypothetical protein GLOIN_2v1474674 [Rhizophagus clarus]
MPQQSPKFIFVDTIQDPETLIQEIKELAIKMKYSFALPIEELIIPNSSTPQNSFFMFKRDQMAKMAAGTEELKTSYYKYKPLFELLYKLQVMYGKETQPTFTNPSNSNNIFNEFGESIDNFIDNDPEIKSML